MDIISQIRSFLVETYLSNGQELADDTELFSTGLLDSFAMIELVSQVEQVAGIRFAAKDITLDNLDSLENIAQYIGRRG